MTAIAIAYAAGVASTCLAILLLALLASWVERDTDTWARRRR